MPVQQGFGLALSVAATSTVMCVAGETGPARKAPGMAWSIAEVARTCKVTSRTLRHYDEIGLLPPAWIGSNGHRHYEEADLLRLQQILLMRELDLGLREIQAVLDSQLDQVAVLREHHQRLLAERDRLEMLDWSKPVGRWPRLPRCCLLARWFLGSGMVCLIRRLRRYRRLRRDEYALSPLR